MPHELTNHQISELKKCETIIERGKDTFVECGIAIARIKDERLYRQDHNSFDEYCKARWGWGKAYAYHLIGAAEVKKSPIGDSIQNMEQAKAILKVPEEKRAEVMEKAAKAGPVTGKSIAQAAEPELEDEEPVIELDKTGWPIPDKALPLFKRSGEVQEILSALSKIKGAIKKAQDEKDPLYAELTFSTVITHLENSYRTIKCALPYAVCTSCQGHQASKCTLCKGKGSISQFAWETFVPKDIKAIREKAKK